MNILIIGASAAGWAAARTLRAEGAALFSTLVVDDRMEGGDLGRELSWPMTPKRVIDHGELGVEVYLRDSMGWTHRVVVDALFWCLPAGSLREQLFRSADAPASDLSRIVVIDAEDDFSAVTDAISAARRIIDHASERLASSLYAAS